MKIVYNSCFGGFGLSLAAIQRYAEIKGVDYKTVKEYVILRGGRADPVLVQVVEELGDKANGAYASLQIAEVPAGSRYRIDEYDGRESVMTPDDYEWEIAT